MWLSCVNCNIPKKPEVPPWQYCLPQPWSRLHLRATYRRRRRDSTPESHSVEMTLWSEKRKEASLAIKKNKKLKLYICYYQGLSKGKEGFAHHPSVDQIINKNYPPAALERGLQYFFFNSQDSASLCHAGVWPVWPEGSHSPAPFPPQWCAQEAQGPEEACPAFPPRCGSAARPVLPTPRSSATRQKERLWTADLFKGKGWFAVVERKKEFNNCWHWKTETSDQSCVFSASTSLQAKDLDRKQVAGTKTGGSASMKHRMCTA